MQKYLLMAMKAAGTPIALQAQGNGVTVVVNDGSQTVNSISGVVFKKKITLCQPNQTIIAEFIS